MAKYFAFSIDDGTVFDRQTIALFNKYGIRGTFNLNSGLPGFVWYLDGHPIERLNHERTFPLYSGHEVASHTLTHPYLDQCPDEEVYRQVSQDVEALKMIFMRDVHSFATPFESSGEREIDIVKRVPGITNIRLSQIDETFAIPEDPFHFKVTALDIDRALCLFNSFKDATGDVLFVYAGHSYDFALANSFDRLEVLIQRILAEGDIRIVTMGELAELLFA
ncbi:MAG: polysaccharide deacetylase family protein [Bacilli bacterium]|nr:polysaccharide deacetylase family protein [Bacilli bacterium]